VKTKGATAGGLNAVGIDSGGAVRLVINALATESKAKLLASPHIMVSDNNEARIQVGQQVPIPTSETYGSSVVAPQRTIQYKDIGIILKVKPMINDSGLVSLEISQEVSDYSTIKLYSNEDQIILTKTEATTKLVVKDGQTIVIGGLIQETDKNAKAGLPWLIKIPIIGYLFGNTSKDKERTELVILLTPHIVKDQTDATAVTDRFIGKFKDEKMSDDIQKNVSGRPKTEKEPVKKQ
jgi:general secretion pathway protein D